jgi:hypothetical protein
MLTAGQRGECPVLAEIRMPRPAAYSSFPPEAGRFRVNLSAGSCVYSPRRGERGMDEPTEAEVRVARKWLARRGVEVAEPTTLLAPGSPREAR